MKRIIQWAVGSGSVGSAPVGSGSVSSAPVGSGSVGSGSVDSESVKPRLQNTAYCILKDSLLKLLQNTAYCVLKNSLLKTPFQNTAYCILLYCLLFFSQLTHAQIYPVQTVHTIVPPYSTKLSDYATSYDVKLRLRLILNDNNVNNRQVRLKLKIQGNGLNIQSRDIVAGAPFVYLNGGTSQVFTNVDLAAYFQLHNLIGINAQQYSRPLPDGAYKICWEVYDFQTNQLISNPDFGCDNIFLLLNDPPFLNLPNRGDQLTSATPFINFTWTPRHANATNVSYEFELREIWDTRIDPQAGFLAAPNYYTQTVFSTTLVYGIGQPELFPEKTYAWRVRAISKTGLSENSVFRNDGYSEIYYFTYTQACFPPIMTLAEPLSNGRVKISWQTHPDHNKYHVQYKRADVADAEWFEVFSYNNQTQIGNLQDGVTYDFRVGGTCHSLTDLDQGYSYSTPNQFTIPTADETVSYSCGIVPEIEISNTDPLTNLGINETFTAGDFPVTVKQVEGANGTYSGTGFIIVPYLADTKIAVAFEGITINTDYQLIDGIIKTTYDPKWGGVESVDEFIEGIKDLVDAVYDTTEDALEDLGILDGAYEEETIDFEIADITVNENGETVIVGTNGEEQNLGAGNNTVVTDKNGNKIAVNEDGEVGAVNKDAENEADEESKETPYYVEVDGRTQQYKYNERMYFVRQKTPATLYLKTSVDSLKFNSPVWKIGSEVIAEGDTISVDLKKLKNKRIDITDSEDSEKKFRVKLKIYEKPITRFDLTVNNRDNFDGTFLFDDTKTGNSTSKQVLEDSGDYEEITNDLFHQDYSIDKKEKYFVPMVGTKLNQTVQLKVKLSSLNNSDPNFKVTLRPTSNYIKIKNQAEYDVTSNNETIDIKVTNEISNGNSPPKYFIEVYDQSNELVGKIEVLCKKVEEKEIRFVYITDENGLESILSEEDVLDKLNISSHNQLFKTWTQESSVSIVLDSLAKYSLQNKGTLSPTVQQVITERDSIRIDHGKIRNAYAYHIGYNSQDMRNKDFSIMFMSSEFNGNTTTSGSVSQVNGSNSYINHTTILYSTAGLNTIAHEQGHDLGLPHVFSNNAGIRKMSKYSAKNNYMDYVKSGSSDVRTMFFKHQMEISK